MSLFSNHIHGGLLGFFLFFLNHRFACKQIMHHEHSTLLTKTFQYPRSVFQAFYAEVWIKKKSFSADLLRSAKASFKPFIVNVLGDSCFSYAVSFSLAFSSAIYSYTSSQNSLLLSFLGITTRSPQWHSHPYPSESFCQLKHSLVNFCYPLILGKFLEVIDEPPE